MGDLPTLKDLDISNKKVLVRVDLDVDLNDKHKDYRLEVLTPTLNYLKEKSAKIILMGHKGRPGGKVVDSLSTKPFEKYFSKWNVQVLENLRFDPRERKNDSEFAKELASKADVFVNEAFATAHREHASIVGVPKILPSAFGLHFEKEVENLSKISKDPDRPLLYIISGIKKDKVEMIKKLESKADKILVGGRLPDYMGDNTKSVRSFGKDEKIIIGNLVMDKEDITVNTIEIFKSEIKKAKTIVLAGVLGKYEDEGHRQGTKAIFEAVSVSSAFRVVGGGDSLTAIQMFGLIDKFDWVSVGGGAMIEFLISGTLPAIEALKS
ncbi:phosphoglycerate kinase [Candidatus Microgenomates bacterium]|nr:phosphoglycerate kinase [Candidatus Microgenomates bacterium]